MIYCAKIVTYYSDLVERSIEVKLRKVILSFIVSVALTVTFIPTMASAAEPSEWDAEAVQTIVQLQDGSATLEVTVKDAYGHDIASQCTFSWYKTGVDGVVTNELISAAYIGGPDGAKFTATETGYYTCAVGYNGDYICVIFEVDSYGEGRATIYAHEVNKVVQLQNGSATLQIYVTDYMGHDITEKCHYHWYNQSSLVNVESKPIDDVGTYDGQYETITVSEPGTWCAIVYANPLYDATALAAVTVQKPKEGLSELAVNGLKVTPKKKKAVVKWTANTDADGYLIQYSMKKNFKKAKVKERL